MLTIPSLGQEADTLCVQAGSACHMVDSTLTDGRTATCIAWDLLSQLSLTRRFYQSVHH